MGWFPCRCKSELVASDNGLLILIREYYFSLDNLCKDMFLRKHMDSKGFVFLSVLANFNRIRQLTQDMELIKLVCLNSVNIEIRTGEDGIDRLRKNEGWQQWVLNMEERDPSAQSEGSSHMHQPRITQPSVFAIPYGFDEIPEAPASYIPQAHMVDVNLHQQHDGINPSMYLPNSAGPMTNGNSSMASALPTSNPATVPESASAGEPAENGREPSPADPQVHNASSFTDEQVESLVIVVRKPISASSALPPPFHSASSRTFSNGSIDGRTITDEISKSEERQSRPIVNGTIGAQL